MKKTLSLIFCFLCTMANCQTIKNDKLYKKDGSIYEVKIIEITDNFVKYKKIPSADNSMLMISKTELLEIEFSNGEKEIFQNSEKSKTGLAQPSNDLVTNPKQNEDVHLRITNVNSGKETNFYIGDLAKIQGIGFETILKLENISSQSIMGHSASGQNTIPLENIIKIKKKTRADNISKILFTLGVAGLGVYYTSVAQENSALKSTSQGIRSTASTYRTTANIGGFIAVSSVIGGFITRKPYLNISKRNKYKVEVKFN